jgi:Cd2+/Zn2+-exporting ATPase
MLDTASRRTEPAHVTIFRIDAIDCPTEEALIHARLDGMAGVVSLSFNLLQRRLTVRHTPASTIPITEAIASLGMRAEAIQSGVLTAIRIEQMDCPTEETLIRGKLGSMAGVAALDFNLMQRVLTVSHDPAILANILAAIRALDFIPRLETTEAVSAQEITHTPSRPWWPLAVAGAAALGAEGAEWFQFATTWLPALLAIAAVAIGGLSTYKKGWVALSNRQLNINALMSIAVTGALALRQWPEAAMVIVLFSLAERIEAASLDRARNAIRGLMGMAPEQATVQQAHGNWQTVDVKSVSVDAVVRLKPGERVPLDGKVLRGHSTLDQAPITGESVPVDKGPGDPLFAGTINQSGEVEYTVTARAGDSTLARIIHAVEAAQGSRAPTQRFVDQFATIYTPVVFVLALLVAIAPPLFFGGAWFDWIYKALVLLVIACPCALVISTPVTIVSGLAAAARNGILIKGGVYLEQGRNLRWLALDKTGTITHGRPVLVNVDILDSRNGSTRDLAASLASRSDHPVSKAIATAEPWQVRALLPIDGFEALPGRGVKGHIDGREYHLGNHRLIHELGWCSDALEAKLTALERQGKTTVLLADTAGPLALFAVADTVKDGSRQAISELHELGVKTLMLSGDNVHTAQAIAVQVGIDEARGDQLPEDKAMAVDQLSMGGAKVGMVGDGINDAPALARADIGFAMGAAGTGTAIETADVALMDDDLRKVATFVRLSRATASVLKQNIALALGIKVVFLALTLAGMGTIWMAVFADMGASLLVVFNGLRLLRR